MTHLCKNLLDKLLVVDRAAAAVLVHKGLGLGLRQLLARVAQDVHEVGGRQRARAALVVQPKGGQDGL